LSFVPISLHRYIKKHLKSNPGAKEKEVMAELQAALKAHRQGVRCSCGEPIWVIGASQVGNMCFTCITGEAYPEDDYELREVCDKHGAPDCRPALERALSAHPYDDDLNENVTDDELPF
jgi:hypothetical protein